MTTHKASKTPAEIGNDAAPHWLSRAEKAVFRAIAAERRNAGAPLSTIEVGIASDYAMARTRIRELRSLLEEIFTERPEFSVGREFMFQIMKELDRTVVMCERLGSRIDANCCDARGSK